MCSWRWWLDSGGNATRNKSLTTLSPSWCGNVADLAHIGEFVVFSSRTIISSRSGELSSNTSAYQGSVGGKSEFEFHLVSGSHVSPFCVPKLLPRQYDNKVVVRQPTMQGVYPRPQCVQPFFVLTRWVGDSCGFSKSMRLVQLVRVSSSVALSPEARGKVKVQQMKLETTNSKNFDVTSSCAGYIFIRLWFSFSDLM